MGGFILFNTDARRMQTYNTFRPTALDVPGLRLEDRQDWLVVPVLRTRDSEPVDESNFHAALEQLGGEGEDAEVHRFGHWGCGWLEIVIVRPGSEAAAIAQQIEQRLEIYPVLDEADLAERELEAMDAEEPGEDADDTPEAFPQP